MSMSVTLQAYHAETTGYSFMKCDTVRVNGMDKHIEYLLSQLFKFQFCVK